MSIGTLWEWLTVCYGKMATKNGGFSLRKLLVYQRALVICTQSCVCLKLPSLFCCNFPMIQVKVRILHFPVAHPIASWSLAGSCSMFRAKVYLNEIQQKPKRKKMKHHEIVGYPTLVYLHFSCMCAANLANPANGHMFGRARTIPPSEQVTKNIHEHLPFLGRFIQ